MSATAGPHGWAGRLYPLRRWLYRGGRPSAFARPMNRVSAWLFSAGILFPPQAVTLEVPGRRTGKVVSFPVAVADLDGERYVVSMLGEDVNWVRNVRAAEGRVVLRRRGRWAVRLVEVAPADRAPVLKRYLEVAPGARPHIPVDRSAPLEEFARIADRYPVFRITSATGRSGPAR